MNSLNKFLTIAFILLFAITAAPTLALLNFEQRAFNADIYQDVFANDGFYDRLPAVIARAFESSSSEKLPTVTKGMTAERWETFIRAVLPPEILKTMGDEALASTFAYLNGKTDSAQFSLAPLKTNMTGDAGVQAVYTLLSAQPDCSLEQIATITMSMFEQGEMQLCNPPIELRDLITPLIQAQLQMTSAALPDQIVIADANAHPGQKDPRKGLGVIRLIMRLSPLIPLGCLFIATILSVRSRKDWLDLWGIPFLVTGIFSALIGLSAPLPSALLQGMLIRRMPAYLPVILLDYANELATAMIRQFLKPLLWQGLLFALIGLTMIAFSFYINRKNASIKLGLQ